MWNFVSALFCMTYISYAGPLFGENLFLPTDDQGNGDVQYASLPTLEANPESLSPEDSASLFSTNEGLGSSIPISQDGDSAVFPKNDPASETLFIEDSPLLTAFDDDSALALNDYLLLPSSSGDSETPASDDLFGTGEFDSGLLSDTNCMSDEEQAVSKVRRGDVCSVVEDSGKKSFPPPYANQDRFNWLPENDPKRRPSNQQRNIRPDFVHCPSGPGGYRMYLICDSGNEADRTYTTDRGVTLVNLKPNRICTLLFLPQTCAKKWLTVKYTVSVCYSPHKLWCCQGFYFRVNDTPWATQCVETTLRILEK